MHADNESTESETINIFDRVRVRYFVLFWFIGVYFLPGLSALLDLILANAAWYWAITIAIAYGQLWLALVLFLTVKIPVQIPMQAVAGRLPTIPEVRSSLTFMVYLFLLASASMYLVFWPLSFWLPEFVTYWLIDIPDIVIHDYERILFWPNVVEIISLCVLAPIIEEVAFRGVILHRWTRKFGLRKAILLSSLVFGVVHPRHPWRIPVRRRHVPALSANPVTAIADSVPRRLQLRGLAHKCRFYDLLRAGSCLRAGGLSEGLAIRSGAGRDRCHLVLAVSQETER